MGPQANRSSQPHSPKPLSPQTLTPSLPLVLILLTAAVLRLWSIDWGAPYLYHPDEHFILHPALNIVRDGDPNPRFFGYPSLLIYLEAGMVAVTRAYANEPLTTDPAVTHTGPWDALPSQWPFTLAGRVLVALCAIGGVWLVYRVGIYWGGPQVGVAAALFLTASPLHNDSSHYLTTDVPAATMLTAALLFSLIAAETCDGTRLAIAGVAAGLAAATKYTAGIIVFVPLGIALSWSPRVIAWRWAVILGAAAAGFCIACPYAVLDAERFWRDLVSQRQHYLSGFAPQGNFRWYFAVLCSAGLTPSIAVLSLVGVFSALLAPAGAGSSSRKVAAVVVSIAIAYFVAVASYPYRAERNVILLLPVLSTFAAALCWRVVCAVLPSRATLPVFAVVVLAAAGPGIIACVHTDQQLGRQDTRTVALRWIDTNVAPGARIAREEYTPQVSGERYAVTYAFSAAAHDYGWYVREGIDYVVLSSNVYDRALSSPYIMGSAGPAFYDFVFAHVPLAAEIAPGPERPGPTIRIYAIPHA